jgi:predicted Kef-type K+ transport protein
MIFTMVVIGLVLVFVIGAIAWKMVKGRSSQG